LSPSPAATSQVSSQIAGSLPTQSNLLVLLDHPALPPSVLHPHPGTWLQGGSFIFIFFFLSIFGRLSAHRQDPNPSTKIDIKREKKKEE